MKRVIDDGYHFMVPRLPIFIRFFLRFVGVWIIELIMNF